MLGAVLVAAGSGTRLGANLPKALVPLAGRPLVRWAAESLIDAGIASPVVVHPAGYASQFRAALAGCQVAALTEGGDTRTDSVRAGVASLAPDVTVVAIHDAARPLMPAAAVRRAVEAVKNHVLAAAPAIAVADTLKQVVGDDVVATIDRRDARAVQTPQVFRRDVLDTVLGHAGHATDELTLVEQALERATMSGVIRLVDGSVFGHKVTTADDLRLLEALAMADLGTTVRVGSGFDVHALVELPTRPLRLAGVAIDSPLALEGHSDADVAAHAVADALLGATARGDLGDHFGVDDPDTAGADSLDFLREITHQLSTDGWQIANVDVTLVAQRPKLAGYRAEMRSRLADALNVAVEQISVKFTTTDHLGMIGRGEGIAAMASCMLRGRER